jgi:hypothetical protein
LFLLTAGKVTTAGPVSLIQDAGAASVRRNLTALEEGDSVDGQYGGYAWLESEADPGL